MKWTTKKEPLRHGDKRSRLKFAWLPTEMDHNVTVWLAFYAIEEEAIVRTDGSVEWLRLRTEEAAYYP